MKYRTCPHCGSHLDYGEQCDCVKEQNEELRKAGQPVRDLIYAVEDVRKRSARLFMR